MYTEEAKYCREEDNPNFKLCIFHDMCGRADIPEDIKAKAYPTMLQGLALDHYYTSIRGAIHAYSLSFDQVCDSTRVYFEGPEHRCSMLNKWNSITLKSVMQKG